MTFCGGQLVRAKIPLPARSQWGGIQSFEIGASKEADFSGKPRPMRPAAQWEQVSSLSVQLAVYSSPLDN